MTNTKYCSICKSPNVTKSTCPLNKNAKNKNVKGHINAVKKIKEYLKCKEKMKKQSQGKQRICHIPLRKQGYEPSKTNRTNRSNRIDKTNASNIQPRIIVLDNDECLGQFGLFSSLYVYSRFSKDPYKINIQELKEACIKYLFPYGVARPYLVELFNLIKKLKHEKKLDGLVMYTSAPNNLSDGKSGYVHFLKDCIETYCDCKNIYDKVLHRNNVIAKVSSCGATIKDLGNVLLTGNQRKVINTNQSTLEKRKLTNYVNTNTKNILMIDDKPDNIKTRSGKALGVSSYDYEGTSRIFENCIKSVTNLKKKLEYYRDPENEKLSVYEGILKEADENHIKYQSHKHNKDFIKVIKSIKYIYE